MPSRMVVTLLALNLVPALAIAQRHGGGHHRGGGGAGQHSGNSAGPRMGYGYGQGNPGSSPLVVAPGRGLAPFTGYGNINHPGLGFAPNTPGVGFPFTTAHPFIGPIRPGATAFGPPVGYGGRHGQRYPAGYYYGGYGRYGYGGYGFGGVAVIGVPVAVPVMVDGYAYPQAPQVIIIQQPAGQGEAQAEERPRHWPGPSRVEREPDKETSLIYETRPPSVEKPSPPLTLLVLKNHSIYAVTDYWKEGDRLCYDTSYGTQNCVSFDLLDLEFTKKLNEERNVKFKL